MRARSHRDQILAELRNVPMFQEIIEIETLVVIASKCALKRYEEGEHIVVEGCPGDSMYVVKSGRVSVTQSCNTDSVVQHQGPAHIELAQLGPKVEFCQAHDLTSHGLTATPP
jgi:CRP-like cAMP-binding protein